MFMEGVLFDEKCQCVGGGIGNWVYWNVGGFVGKVLVCCRGRYWYVAGVVGGGGFSMFEVLRWETLML